MESLKLDSNIIHKKIESSPEYLKKLFIMPDIPDGFIEFGVHLLDMIHDFFKEKGGIHSSISLQELGEIFNHIEIPEKPVLIRDVLDEIKHNIIRHSVKVANPYYIGHMTSAIPYFMMLLEMISVSLNQNQVKIESAKASSFVEREFLCWIHKLVFNKSAEFYKANIQNHCIALGDITSDGSIANLTALSLAMAKAFPPDGKRFKGIREEGIINALKYYGYRQGIFLVSKRGHYSICKSGTILGIGKQNVIYVPVDPYTNKMSTDKLWGIIDKIKKEDKKEGLPTKIIALIGIAGTTETGNIDPLDKLADIAGELDTHYHVDAAWGGGALLKKREKDFLRGIEKADTVSLDAHKLLYSPSSMGICLFKNVRESLYLYHTSDYIIRKGSVDQGRFTIEGSRPFSCLKPWAAFKIIGRDGYNIIFEHATNLQKTFVGMIKKDHLFELLNEPELFIINYRFVPKELKKRLDEIIENPVKYNDEITEINNIINDINIELHKTIREKDTSFVSRTRLESTKYAPRKIVVLRAVTVNPLTEEDMLKKILNEHRRLGKKIWQAMNWSYKKGQRLIAKG
ncbi:MAG: pyridoxal-dependent decarboxylase [Thermodesulfobacteriota bacterium]|nr:pyridoxal-dependent decarboxylase [Thermodesulfobacteriota bacterium]